MVGEIDFLMERLHERPHAPAVAFGEEVLTYGGLHELVVLQSDWLDRAGVHGGDRVVLLGDYSPLGVSMLLALINRRCIIIPLTPATQDSVTDSLAEVHPSVLIDVTGSSPVLQTPPASSGALPDLYDVIKERGVPGLVLFTSGSSGRPKAVVHDFSRLLNKFRVRRPAMVTLSFLLFDHWGGLNTLLHCISNLCFVVIPKRRTPNHVCALIEKYRVELLPTTPSFLSVLLLSGEHQRHDLTSLKLITYGAEPMPEAVLARLVRAMPDVELRQTYGMIELGVLRAKSRSSGSLWVKVGGEGYDVRVVDGMLQIRAESAMLGYINAASPFTEDGYLMTGDMVETDGDWIRILGRKSDIINVGGQKVFPAEVETAVLTCPAVADVVVYGEGNPLLGSIVCAKVVLQDGADEAVARRSIREVCKERLQAYMAPAKVTFVFEIEQSSRLKRVRRAQ